MNLRVQQEPKGSLAQRLEYYPIPSQEAVFVPPPFPSSFIIDSPYHSGKLPHPQYNIFINYIWEFHTTYPDHARFIFLPGGTHL